MNKRIFVVASAFCLAFFFLSALVFSAVDTTTAYDYGMGDCSYKTTHINSSILGDYLICQGVISEIDVESYPADAISFGGVCFFGFGIEKAHLVEGEYYTLIFKRFGSIPGEWNLIFAWRGK